MEGRLSSAETSSFSRLLTSSQRVLSAEINFRAIGESEYNNRVEYYMLKNPSVKPPQHRKRLLTFTEKQTRRKKGSEIERERKLQLEVWKKRDAYVATTGAKLSTSYEQCLELPRAIANTDGTPTKGAKSNTTNVLQKQYEKADPAIINCIIIETWMDTTCSDNGGKVFDKHYPMECPSKHWWLCWLFNTTV